MRAAVKEGTIRKSNYRARKSNYRAHWSASLENQTIELTGPRRWEVGSCLSSADGSGRSSAPGQFKFYLSNPDNFNKNYIIRIVKMTMKILIQIVTMMNSTTLLMLAAMLGKDRFI